MATTRTFLDKSESLFTDQSKKVDILFWVLIFTLYFIDFKDSRGNDLFALGLATLNTVLGVLISYMHYKLVQALLEKKSVPFPTLSSKKVTKTIPSKTYTFFSFAITIPDIPYTFSYPVFYKLIPYHLNIIFPIYFVLTSCLVISNAVLYKELGNQLKGFIKEQETDNIENQKIDDIAKRIDSLSRVPALAEARAKDSTKQIDLAFKNLKLLIPKLKNEHPFNWTSNIPEATTIIFLFMGLMYALRFHRQYIETENERERHKLEALRWQLKPHFLLGALNSFSHAVDEQNKEEGHEIIRLMRDLTFYIVDEASYYKPQLTDNQEEEKKINEVELPKEENFLRKFIKLKQFEKGYSSELIQFNTTPYDADYLLTPMILICYVENAFTHGLDRDTLKRPIRIDLKVENDTLYFSVLNYKPIASTQYSKEDIHGVRQNKQKERTTNLGMAATEMLLKAAYPHDKYSLKKSEDAETFKIELTIFELNKRKI
jgi:hypothetical protein